MEVFLVKRQKLASTKVCSLAVVVVSAVVVLLVLFEPSSLLLLQEMKVKLKRDIKIM